MNTVSSECWVITDHAAGNQRQALALAGLLGLPVRHLVLEPRAPWSWLAPRLLPCAALALRPAQRHLFAPPWPIIAIGCGRASALFTRRLRRLAGGRCHTVQILDPRLPPRHWDTVIAPRHDRLLGPNVLTALGSLNPIDDAWLRDGRDGFPRLGQLPQPRVGVLLGGPRKGLALDADYARSLAQRLRADWDREGGSVLVVASRRTPPALVDALELALKGLPTLVWKGVQDGPNPYPGVLGWADRLVVTPDSVNMLSEACAVGCPVQTLACAPLPPKLARFHQALAQSHLLGSLGAEPPRGAAALRETAAIAAQLRRRLAAGPTHP